MVQRPPSADRLPNCLQRLPDWPLAGRKCRNDYRAKPLASDERRSRENQTTGPESRHAGSYPLAIDELRLRRMENQSAGPEADLRAFQSLRASSSLRQWRMMSSAYLSKGMEGKLRAIQVSESIVQEQISQDGADHPHPEARPCRTRDDATVPSFRRELLASARYREARPWAVGMVANRLEQPLPIDAVKIALDINIEHPVRSPATLSGSSGGRRSPSAGAVSIGVIVEDGAPGWAPDTV